MVEATVQRARPVILTTLAATLAFIPLTQFDFWARSPTPSSAAPRSGPCFHGDAEDVVLPIKPHGAADALGWRFHFNQEVAE